MKIYTGTGDSGKTSLFSGERLKKNDIRVEAYGSVDELCSFIGVIGAVLPECREKEGLRNSLLEIQSDLFAIGALLATLPGSANADLLKPVGKERTNWLESRVDALQENLPELRAFILPGGHSSAAWSQVARAVCRRSERCIISLADQEGVENLEDTLTYMNRLSDFFFVVARYCNKISGVTETTWHG